MITKQKFFLFFSLSVVVIFIWYLSDQNDISVEPPSEYPFWKPQIPFKVSEFEEKVDKKKPKTEKKVSAEERVRQLVVEEIRKAPVLLPIEAIKTEAYWEVNEVLNYKEVGDIFRDRLVDGTLGPELVVIQAGRFRMGYIQGEEKPVHDVSVDRFAMGRYEVTFEEYDKFAEATGRDKPDDEGWGRGNRPVIYVSKSDAIAYAEWLSKETGETYRLPTEAEWEYAARAGTETKYWWGNEIESNRANCDGCGSPWDNEETAPVGSFPPNAFELYDMVGNVREWTCSKYEEEFNGEEQQCLSKYDNSSRVIRGGSWYDLPAKVGVTHRTNNWWSSEGKINFLGIRLVRM